MDPIDIEKEAKEFLDELNAGKFTVESRRIKNTADDYINYEDRDLAAYKDYLASDAFKALIE